MNRHASISQFTKGLLVLGSIGLFVATGPSYAQPVDIVADGAAPAANQPTVDRASAPVPVVNIVTPDANGFSHNKYTHFNIPAGGAVLNNSLVEGDTRSFGRIGANPNLAGAEATRILNEVTSTNPSLLAGQMEVHGGQASVILANPNGITCASCSLYNSRHYTLTTGVPNIVDGRLASFSVDQGHIAVTGPMSVLPSTDQSRSIDIISKTFELSATGEIGVGGSRLRQSGVLSIVTGQNDVVFDGAFNLPDSSITRTGPAIDAARAGYAIDAAALGAMFVGNIILVSTQQGVGVNTAGISDDIRVSSRIATENFGSGLLFAQAEGNVRFNNGNEIFNFDLEASNGAKVTSKLGGIFIDNYDIGTRFGNIELTARKDISVNLSKLMSADDRYDITLTSTDGNVDLTDSVLDSAADITLAGHDISLAETGADHLDRAQLKAGSDITLNARTWIDNGLGGLIEADNNLTMVLGPDSGVGPMIDVGEVKVGRRFRATGFGATVTFDRPIEVGTSFSVDTAGVDSVLKIGSVSIAGGLEANSVFIDSGAVTVGGAVRARNGRLTVMSQNQSNLRFDHGLSATTSLTLDTDGNIILRDNVSAGGDIVLNAGSGSITNHAVVNAGGNINITASSLSNLITYGGISYTNYVARDGDDIDVGALIVGEGTYRVEKGFAVPADRNYVLEGGKKVILFNRLFANRCGVSFTLNNTELPGGFTCLYSYEEALPNGLTGTVARPEIFSSGNIDITLTGDFLNRAGLVQAAGNLNVTADNFTNEGVRANKTADILGFTFLGMSNLRNASIYNHTSDICTTAGVGASSVLICDASRFLYFDRAFDGEVTGIVPRVGIPRLETTTAAPVRFEVETTVPDARAAARILAGGTTNITANSIVDNVGSELAVVPNLDLNAFLLSIDAALARLNFDSDLVLKQAGVSFDEVVVKEQITTLTGARLLEGFSSQEAQLLALTEAGRKATEAFGVAPGVALTADQISRLSEDVVVYVKIMRNGREITVPKVYLAAKSLGTYANTAVIGGMNVSLAGGHITNSGHILGRVGTVVEASTGSSFNDVIRTSIGRSLKTLSVEEANARMGSVTNTGVIGSLDMQNNIATVIKSGGDITNSGVIVGRNVQLESTTGDINIETTREDATFGKTAVVGAVDDITLKAGYGRDVNVKGAMVETLQGDIKIKAQNLNVEALEVQTSGQSITSRGRRQTTTTEEVEQTALRKTTTTTTITQNRFSGTQRTSSSETLYGSVLQANSGNLYVDTYADMNVEGSTVKVGGDTVLAIGRDMNIKALKTTDTYIETESESGTITTITTMVPDGVGYRGGQADGIVALFNTGYTTSYSSYEKGTVRAGIIELVKPSIVEIGGSLYMDTNGDATLDGAVVSVNDNLYLDIGGDMALLATKAASYTKEVETNDVAGHMISLTPLMLKTGLEFANSKQTDMVEWSGNVTTKLDVAGNAVGRVGGDVTNEGVIKAAESAGRDLAVAVGGVKGGVHVDVGGVETRIDVAQNSRTTSSTYSAMNYGVYLDLTLPGGGDPDSAPDALNIVKSGVDLVTSGPSSLFAPQLSVNVGSKNTSSSTTVYEDGSSTSSSSDRETQVTVSVDPQVREFADFYIPVEALTPTSSNTSSQTGRPNCNSHLCQNPELYVADKDTLFMFHDGESAAGAKGIVVDAATIVRSKMRLLEPKDVSAAADKTITRLNSGDYNNLDTMPDNVKKSILLDHQIITPEQARNVADADLNALLSATMREAMNEAAAQRQANQDLSSYED